MRYLNHDWANLPYFAVKSAPIPNHPDISRLILNNNTIFTNSYLCTRVVVLVHCEHVGRYKFISPFTFTTICLFPMNAMNFRLIARVAPDFMQISCNLRDTITGCQRGLNSRILPLNKNKEYQFKSPRSAHFKF